MRDPIELPAGDYPVVLDSYAVMDFTDWLGYLGFSALAVQEERSFYEPGRVVASPLVSISDDAADPAGTPASFDYEGVRHAARGPRSRPASAATSCTTHGPRRGPAANRPVTACRPPIRGGPSRCT